MNARVYPDPAVRARLAKAYIPVAADRDERPDLSNRYPGYDEPMIVVYNGDASEILELRGFRSADDIASILQAVIDDPSPGPSAKKEAPVEYAAKADFDSLRALRKSFDDELKQAEGFSAFGVRNIDEDAVDYAFELARRGDSSLLGWAREAATSARLLLDPVSGGAYQSMVTPANRVGDELRYLRIQLGDRLDDTDASWNEPHFEHRLATQARAIRIFSKAYGQWHNPADLEAAQRVHEFVRRILTTTDGAFYAALRADPSEPPRPLEPSRAARPSAARVPPSVSGAANPTSGGAAPDASSGLDTRLYARENGWMIAALCDLHAVSGDKASLDEAIRAADWIERHRSLDGGGFSHEETDGAGPFLGDTLAMGQAFLALFRETNDSVWLARADSTFHFVVKNFELPSGFATSKSPTDPLYQSRPDRAENAALVRFTSLLRRYEALPEAAEVIQRAGRYLTTPDVAKNGLAAPLLRAQLALEPDTTHSDRNIARADPGVAH
jgi:uncharacterized protein